MKEIDQLRARVDAGELVPGLGAKADTICNEALEQFSTEASETQGGAMDTVFDSKVRTYDGYDILASHLQLRCDATCCTQWYGSSHIQCSCCLQLLPRRPLFRGMLQLRLHQRAVQSISSADTSY
jgi:hypothetical protein